MKYQTELSKIPDCPPRDAKAKNTECFRFVFAPVCEKSFKPQAITQPLRISDEKDPKKKCSLTGLSFFTTESSAVAVYNNIKMIKNFKKTKIGSHLARGKLDINDGLQTPVKRNHFDLHPSKSALLQNKFKIMRAL